MEIPWLVYACAMPNYEILVIFDNGAIRRFRMASLLSHEEVTPLIKSYEMLHCEPAAVVWPCGSLVTAQHLWEDSEPYIGWLRHLSHKIYPPFPGISPEDDI